MHDILDRLDAELAAAPDPTFDLASTIATGRRAVRRRRLATGAAAAVAAVAIAGTAWLAIPDGTPGGQDGAAASDPTSSATTPATPESWEEMELLRSGSDGRETAVNPEATVIERADYTAANGASGEIFHLGYRGDEYYALAADAGFIWVRLPVQGMTLPEWAEGQLTGEKVQASGADWVTFDDRSRLIAQDGVRIVEQRSDPGLGDNFAGPGDATAVAQVEVDGTTYFLVARAVADGTTDVIPYAKDATIATLDAFVEFARERYATNGQGGSEGLR